MTHQILMSTKDLKQTFVVSIRVEQLRLCVKKLVVTTVEDSVLRTEMDNLESEEEDDPRRVLWYKPMSWLGQIRPHRRDEAWSAGLWQAFFASCVGATVPALAELPLSACGCKKNGSSLGGSATGGPLSDYSQGEDRTSGSEPGSTMWGHRPRGLHLDIDLAGYIANYKLIGKLTASLQLQEFS